jgi:hypothetical protein
MSFMGGGTWGEYFYVRKIIEPGIVTVPPGKTCIVFTDIFKTTTNTSYGKVSVEPIEFRIDNFAEKFIPCVQKPWPTLHVNVRPTQEERKLIDPFLQGMGGQFHVPKRGRVETTSGIFTMQQFLPPLDLIWIHHDRNLPNLFAWRTFEAKLSPGTFRDMIRLGRIQVQYLDGHEETALDELRGWFAKMEPIQSTVLAASFCLPEGLEVESENDRRFMFISTWFTFTADGQEIIQLEAYQKSHRYYMAMRRAIDEVVRPYNTLPKRKLREKSEPE